MWMYHVSASSPAPWAETIRGVPRKFWVIALSLGFSGLVFERSRRRSAAREIDKKSDEPAEDAEHHEQKHEHAGEHSAAKLGVGAAETNGAGVGGGREEKGRQEGGMTKDE